MNICEEIREARGPQNTRCGIVNSPMDVSHAASILGLSPDGAVYRPIGRDEADEIAFHILHARIADGVEIMSRAHARELWRRFMTQFKDEDVQLATNVGMDTSCWTPATRATFDMGIFVLGTARVGYLWIEEED